MPVGIGPVNNGRTSNTRSSTLSRVGVPASQLHRLAGQPAVLVDPFPPAGIVHGVLGTHLGGERVECLLQPKQLLLAPLDIQRDR